MIYKIFRMFFLFGIGFISMFAAGTYSLTTIILKNGK